MTSKEQTQTLVEPKPEALKYVAEVGARGVLADAIGYFIPFGKHELNECFLSQYSGGQIRSWADDAIRFLASYGLSIQPAHSSSATMRAALVEARDALIAANVFLPAYHATKTAALCDKVITRIDAALNAGGEGDGWLDIASAPKDGRPVFLGLWVNEGTPQAQWESYRGEILSDVFYGDNCPWDISDFTHWHPDLPAPPTPAKGD